MEKNPTNLDFIWTPESIISMVDILAWPVVVLSGIVILKSNVIPVLRAFFKKNRMSELSVGTSGAHAKFQASQEQPSEEVKKVASTIEVTSNHKNIIKQQDSNSSELSKNIAEMVKAQAVGLDVSDIEKIEMLSTEVGLLKVAIACYDINKAIFRSQYDLLNNWLGDGSSITQEQVVAYFEEQVKKNNSAFTGWDYIKYISYLISSGLIEHDGSNYKLTVIGNAYIKFMRKNPQHIASLVSL